MGMSASQLRYTMLAARKSDIEFQGQQVNQQRTTLATESSNINAQLLNMTVPVPPSSNDFTKTDYSFTCKANLCTINGAVTLNEDGATYKVNYTYDTKENTKRNEKKTIYEDSAGVPSINGTALTNTKLSTTTPTAAQTAAHDKDAANLKIIYGDNYDETKDTYFKYASSDGTTYYIAQSEIDAKKAALAAKTPPETMGTSNEKSTDIEYHYVEAQATKSNSGTWNKAKIDWSDSGRMTGITDDDGNKYAVSTSSTEDTAGYEDSMNEYNYEKDNYNKTMTEINAKIDIIQGQDKKLELKLQNLDTQDQAINTELESVKKVIDKNIENSFKAFA